MRKPIFRLGILSLLVGTAALAACGGGDADLTVEQYFERVQTITDDGIEGSDALQPRFDALEESDIADLHDLISDLAALLREALEAFDRLNPPTEVEGVHNEFVGAGLALVDEYEQSANAASEADTMEEAFFAFVGGPDVEAASTRFETVCTALEAAASEALIEVDLDCGGGG